MGSNETQAEILTKKEQLKVQKDIFKRHIFESYFNLRTGIAVLAILLPLVLLIWGYTVEGELRGSMSDYYNTGKPMRDWFVGNLWAIGVFLILYKGWERKEGRGLNENWALNFAGFCAIGVAMFPTQPGVTVHDIFAVILFFLMAYVCIRRAFDTLDELENKNQKNWFKGLYYLWGGLMGLTPIIAWSFANMFEKSMEQYIFWVESSGVWVFGFYWLTKTSELSYSGMERMLPDVSAKPLTEEKPSKVVEVDPGLHNFPTGVQVEEGEQYELQVTGKWIDWFITCGPEGWGRWNPLKYFNRKPGKPFFELCGNVGKSRVKDLSFCIDEGYIWTIPKLVEDDRPLKDHQIYLFANDWSIAYGNNRKHPKKPLTVTITRKMEKN